MQISVYINLILNNFHDKKSFVLHIKKNFIKRIIYILMILYLYINGFILIKIKKKMKFEKLQKYQTKLINMLFKSINSL